MTTAAMTVAGHENAIFIAKKSIKNFPIGPLIPKIHNKKNPTTVGGSTIGSVKIPSSTLFIVSFNDAPSNNQTDKKGYKN